MSDRAHADATVTHYRAHYAALIREDKAEIARYERWPRLYAERLRNARARLRNHQAWLADLNSPHPHGGF